MNKVLALALVGVGLYLVSRESGAGNAEIAYWPEVTDYPIEPTLTEYPSIETESTMTRGERNNNPGNIDKGPAWQGLAPTQPDSRFATFINAEYGIRALGKLLQTYESQGFNTIRKIISKYAPGSENDTDSYIAAVSKKTGIGPDVVISARNESVLLPLVDAIILHENGRNIYAANGVMQTGIDWALV